MRATGIKEAVQLAERDFCTELQPASQKYFLYFLELKETTHDTQTNE